MQTGQQSNRLARETSPYLLQHAHNPVDWYPWGDEAFEAARRRNVPIFLSVGYSTCYWCHVMERESFESEAIARIMNEKFVNVKVDREERPDVDDIYMTATQVLSGRGGWPMSCFLEPRTLRPFWCGTYFPPEPRMGMPGFAQVLESISEAWRNRPEEVIEQAGRVAEAVEEYVAAQRAPVGLGLAQVSKAAQGLLQMLDRTWGGFGQAPKFPQPVFLEFLLDVRESAGDDGTRQAVDEALRLTLDKMAIGGLRDQVGGGFHRYSVDQMWTVPHFEKMLYDNAQLVGVYARAGALYDDAFYREVAASTVEYVLKEMTSSDGGFLSAQDAEVDGREGLNYIWTAEEVAEILGREDAEFAKKVYELDRGPNFKDPHHAEAEPVNVLRMDDRPDKVAQRLKMEPDAFRERLGKINRLLYEARSRRKQPRLDDKVITSWNGMMVQGLTGAGVALDDHRFLTAAEKAIGFVVTNLHRGEGLLRTWRGGQGTVKAVLEDYACLVAGLLALERAEQGQAASADASVAAPAAPDESRNLALARMLVDEAQRLFGDPATGGYFDTRADQSDLFVRPRTMHDGAIPAGSSVMLHNLIDLYVLTKDRGYLERALACASSMSAAISQSPVSSINATRAVLRLLSLGQGEQLAAIGPVAEETEAQPRDFTPVEVYAETDRIEVGPDSPARFRVAMKIAEGYHLTAADPGSGGAGLMPLRVHVVNGSGIAAYADYPPGEAYGAGGELRVYRGEVEFPIAVELQGEWQGRPLVAMTFQACTERECLEAMTVELDVAVDRTK